MNGSEGGENLVPQHILVIEDDSVWMNLYKRSFKDRGIEVSTASGVKEALELLKNGVFTRVITDGLEGGWIRVAWKAQELGLPIKLVTGDFGHQKDADAMGVEFLPKSLAAKQIRQL